MRKGRLIQKNGEEIELQASEVESLLDQFLREQNTPKRGKTREKQPRKISRDEYGRTNLERALANLMIADKVPQWQRFPRCSEYRFYEHRNWQADFAWPEAKVLVEVEGGTWDRGEDQSRHTRGEGYENDCHKYNTANLLGYCLIRVTSTMIRDGSALFYIKEALKQKG